MLATKRDTSEEKYIISWFKKKSVPFSVFETSMFLPLVCGIDILF